MGRPQNRLELRKQFDAAEPLDPVEDDSEELIDDVEEETTRKKKKPAKASAKAKAPKAAKATKSAARMRIVWAVVNDAYKTIATFEYTNRELAQAKADEMIAKGKGFHFVQKVKEEMKPDAPGLGAAIPRSELVAAAPAKAADAIDEEEEAEIEEDEDEEEDYDDEEDFED